VGRLPENFEVKQAKIHHRILLSILKVYWKSINVLAPTGRRCYNTGNSPADLEISELRNPFYGQVHPHGQRVT